MNRLFRIFAQLLTFGVAGSACLALAQDVPTAPSADAEMPSDLDAVLDAMQPEWMITTGLSVSGGYKDNLLLSRSDPASSAFTRAGFEGLLWRVPRGRVDYFGFLNGQYTRYFSPAKDRFRREVDDESQAFAGFEWRFREPDTLHVTLDAQGYYLDQVFDVSDPSVTRSIAVLRVQGAKVGPTVRWYPARRLWLEANAMFDRQRFDDKLNDADIRNVTSRVGWSANDGVELSAGATERRRDFDRRAPEAPGRVLAGLLSVREREAEGRLDVKWGAARQWRSRTRGGSRRYEDNGVGYLDFRETLASQEFEWSSARWRALAETGWRYKKYEQQFAGEGSAPPRVVKKELSLSVRLERKWSEQWTVFAEFNHERVRSNDEVAAYRTKEGLLGVRWNWEK